MSANINKGDMPKDNYTVVRNDIIYDPELSFTAIGVLVTLLSRPPDWDIHTWQLAQGKKKVKATLTALRELEKAGYYTCKRYPDPNKNGRFVWLKKVYAVPLPPAERTWKPNKHERLLAEENAERIAKELEPNLGDGTDEPF